MTTQQQLLKLTILISSLVLLGNSFAATRDSSTAATYNSSSSLLSLPIVSVDNSLYYQVEMQLISSNPTLLKLTTTAAISRSEQVSASYDSSTSVLSIPTLSINGLLYSADLIRDTSLSGYQFTISSFLKGGSYKIIDTGQSNCYSSSGSATSCTDSGQDAAYSGNQPSFTNNGDGTITDNVSGLIWQQGPDTDGNGTVGTSDKLSQSDAISYCSNLVLASQTDWRLPDIKTMYSLINFSGEDASTYSGSDTSILTPYIDTDYFSFAYGDTSEGERIIDVQYVTTTNTVSTIMTGDAGVFGVNMADGRIKGYNLTIGRIDKTFTVQCVRGDETYAVNSFTDNNDNTISDSTTALMWEKNDSQTTMDWDTAISHCEDNTTANYTNWRLPNAKELQGIVDYGRSPDTSNSAAIDSVFNATSFTNEAAQTDWGYYWTSTTHKNSSGNGSNAVYIAFGRALGYMNDTWLDVHGAGAQRSNTKSSSNSLDRSYTTVTDENGDDAITHGPQGDVVRFNNYVRCVR